MKRQWGIGQVTSEYLRRMETLLTLYAQPYDPRFPVVYFEERPCFLLGEVVEGLAPQPAQSSKKGQPAKEHYAYTKPGSCCVLAAVEPRPGQRLYQVRSRRTKREYTQFRQQLAARYPQAEQIRLVQDKLNTHARSTFYACLPAVLAQKLAARFEVYYTPTCGSWLNQIELDCSALARQCLKRRIPSPAQFAYLGLVLEPPAPAASYQNPLAIHPRTSSADAQLAVLQGQQGQQALCANLLNKVLNKLNVTHLRKIISCQLVGR